MSITPKIIGQFTFNTDPQENFICTDMDSNPTYHFRVAGLSSTKVFATYALSGAMYGRVGNLISGSWVWGAETLLGVTVSNYYPSFQVIALSETLVIASFADADNSYYPTCMALTISGSAITIGAKYVVASYVFQYSAVDYLGLKTVKLDTAKFAIVFSILNGSNYNFQMAVGSVSDTAITYGTAVTLFTTTTANLRIYNTGLKAISSTKVICLYNNSNASTEGTTYCRICNISGTTVSAATQYDLSIGTSTSMSWSYSGIKLCMLSAAKFILFYLFASSSTYGCYAKQIDVSGNAVSINSVTNYISKLSGISASPQAFPTITSVNEDGSFSILSAYYQGAAYYLSSVYTLESGVLSLVRAKRLEGLSIATLYPEAILDTSTTLWQGVSRVFGGNTYYYLKQMQLDSAVYLVTPIDESVELARGVAGGHTEITRIDFYSGERVSGANTQVVLKVNDIPIKIVTAFSANLSYTYDSNKETYSLEMAHCPIILRESDVLTALPLTSTYATYITIYGLEEVEE